MRTAPSRLVVELADVGVVTVDEFVSPSHCQRILREAAHGAWVPSGVAAVPLDRGRSTFYANGRTSSSLVVFGYSKWMKETLRRIERSLFTMFGIRSRNLEPWQVTRYKRGEAFDYHLDCGAWRAHPSGERSRTILVYLEQPVRGGATDFRALRRRIMPAAGRLVVWNNLLPSGNCNHAMIHAGLPVVQGRKTILTTWERQRRYVG
jgi:2OG-Fe(II) oxygenase superfamily.